MPKEHFVKDAVKVIRVDCPPEVFDVEGAYIMRRKQVAVWKLDTLKAAKQNDTVSELLKDLVPDWHGVVDVESGEPLPPLSEQPNGWLQLSTDQVAWILETLQSRWNNLPKSTNGQM
jgi:hypothetical protein